MWIEPIFKNRQDAGRDLARKLIEFSDRDDVIVLALPRGGVPVAFEVARALEAPLDVFIVRKLGLPGQEELALGALASGGTVVLNESIIRAVEISQRLIDRVLAQEQRELERREKLYRAGLGPLDVRDRLAIVVDDGLATGATMAAAVSALQKMGPKKIVVAVPVSSAQAIEDVSRKTGVRCVAAHTPEPFYGVGMWYEDFSQTSDEVVQRLLTASREKFAHARSG